MAVKFSLILPVYNVEKFLPDCLESLLAQDLPETEYEIICVIDGSPDNSKAAVQSYMAKHRHIRLLEQPNSGVCAARNRGFQAAVGKYVWFIDPDDMIAAGCLGKIYRLMEKYQADIFEFDYSVCGESATYQPRTVNFAVDGENREGSSGSGWLSVCLAEYLRRNHIEWNTQLHYGEDYLWALQTKYRKHRSIYTHARLYLYRQRADSAMHIVSREKTEKHYQDMLLLFDIYGEEYERCKVENMPDGVSTNLQRRRQLCAETALCYLLKLKLPGHELKSRLADMKQRGCYPYPLMWWNLGRRSVLGPWHKRLLKFLFPFEHYFLLASRFHR